MPISRHTYEEVWELVRHEEELFDPDFPLILAAGERRSYNANQIMRDPDWRRNDPDGALRIHPADAAGCAVSDGARALCESRRGAVEVTIAFDPAQRRGFVSLPHGYGQEYPDLQTEEMIQHGPRLNESTSSTWCDPIAKTPYHKYIPVRVKPLPANEA